MSTKLDRMVDNKVAAERAAGNTLSSEDIARLIGTDSAMLRARFAEYINYVVDDFRKVYRAGTFDFETKTLTSNVDGIPVRLRFKLRAYVTHTPSYTNQQTSRGDVYQDVYSAEDKCWYQIGRDGISRSVDETEVRV